MSPRTRMPMSGIVFTLFLVLLVFAACSHAAPAVTSTASNSETGSKHRRPAQSGKIIPSLRTKRSGISDQRLMELETLLALERLREQQFRDPIAYGLIDPDRIG